MTYGPFDLRLANALAQNRLAAAHRVRIGMTRRPSAREAPPECRSGRDRVALPRPAHGAAAGN
jgi:hypothetical protein